MFHKPNKVIVACMQMMRMQLLVSRYNLYNLGE